ncbi:MAG: hypothetical protein MI923_01175, partial [Phycisphaerales bacterium]|nr:hypothetical protein [Phycisphaerales bacterium]
MRPPHQSPPPGSRLIYHRGDIIRVSVSLPSRQTGRAWLRTNIGHAEMRRAEIVGHVERGEPILERDWHDLPMPS